MSLRSVNGELYVVDNGQVVEKGYFVSYVPYVMTTCYTMSRMTNEIATGISSHLFG